MYVIVDMEWETNKQGMISPTQLSAARVDEDWNVIIKFNTLIRPKDPSFYNWESAAYTGARPENFLFARSCHTAFDSFHKWLGDGDDILCWWTQPSREIYEKMCKVILKEETTRPYVILDTYMRGFLEHGSCIRGSAHKLAKARDIDVPLPQHDSRNDVEAIRCLLRGVGFPQALLSEPPVKPQPVYNHENNGTLPYIYDATNGFLHKNGCQLIPDGVDTLAFGVISKPLQKRYRPCSCVAEEYRSARREKVIREINSTDYIYMYTESSKVFHRYDCGLLHNAWHVLGTVKYSTAIGKGMRPCKVCNPVPEDRYDSKKVQSPRPKRQKYDFTKRERKKTKREQLQSQGFTSAEITAVLRLEQSKKERFENIGKQDMTEQQTRDMYTLTQPRLAFFASKGYSTFHQRNCSRLVGRSNIRGFETFSQASRAGYTPCKLCKPTKKQNLLVSIPIESKERADESVEDLVLLCKQYGYENTVNGDFFELTTPVGRWRIDTASRPVTVEHVNLAHNPKSRSYHQQHRIFLSMTDALLYIHRHDKNLQRSEQK
ncbi:MAG: hypothetical protein IJW65_00710 [Clostridia bacterium]|nr:hypothetical protein [Clostridia bacterium]